MYIFRHLLFVGEWKQTLTLNLNVVNINTPLNTMHIA
jgi:hypothetical protein